MANTLSQLVNTVVGNQRKVVWRVTVDAAATSFVTGLEKIEDFQIAIQSAVTRGTDGCFVRCDMNADPAGTATLGSLAMTSAVSGDEYIVTLNGK